VTDPLLHPLIAKRRAELQLNLQNISQRGFHKEKFCLMPFVNIILEPNGSVGLCRHKGTEHSLGNLKQNTWQEIWNGPEAQRWRQEFLSGEPVTCKKEIKDQHCNLCPELGKMMLPKKQLRESMGTPLRLTANFNGRCNLQCQMCDVWKLPNDFYTEENFWASAREHLFPQLKEIDMLSGEPFIQADTFKLIDEVSLVNPSCKWSITTNAHWKLNQKIIDGLNKIEIKNIILSVDSLDPNIYKKIRYPGNLERVLATIEDLREYETQRGKGRELNMNLNFLVQKDNWHEIPEVIDYCLSRNIHPFITFCYIPSEHSLLTLDIKMREKILRSFLKNLTWGELALSHRILNPLISSLAKIDQSNYLLELNSIKENYEKNDEIKATT